MTALTKDQLAAYIVQRLEAGARPAALAEKIARYLTLSRRSAELNAIMRKVMKLRERQGLTEATVTSAFPVTGRARSEVRRVLGADRLIINEVIDPGVIGGVRIETADSALDMTVKAQLRQLKQRVNKGAKT